MRHFLCVYISYCYIMYYCYCKRQDVRGPALLPFVDDLVICVLCNLIISCVLVRNI